MYAQLCKRLSEQAPNLEPPGQPCTFRLLLLNKCRAEFEGRAQAFAAFEGRALTAEDEERRHLAKCKMLGNIKFIGELGKLEILAESILHRCIQQLLARRPGADHHEDLECLAQLVRTCGRVLDSARGRGLMDQYFARIEALANARELAPRIRFMLRDVAELRRSGWVPRQASAAAAEGPVPIHQLRPDDEPRRPPPERQDALFRARRPLDDVLAGLALQPQSMAPNSHGDKLFPNGFGRDAFRQRGTAGGGPFYPRGQPFAGGGGGGGKGSGGGGGGRRDEPKGRSRVPQPAALADVQMRPDPSSLVFTATRLSREPQHAPAPLPHAVLAPASFTSAPLVKEPALTINIKPAPDSKNKPKKDKGMSKEEACRLAVEAVEEAAAELGDGDEQPDGSGEWEPAAARRLTDLQLPDKLLRRALAAALERALGDGSEGLCAAAAAVVRAAKRAPVTDALRPLLQHEPPSPRLPLLLAHAVAARLVTLAELGSWCEPPELHATMLGALQELHRLLGEERLLQLYAESKLNAATYVEGGGGGGGVDAGGALDALEARGLGALVPQLRVQAALARQLAAEPAPHELFRWIKANVEPAVRGNAAFVSTLVALVARHVTAAAGSGGTPAPDKAALEREKRLVEGWAPLLTRLLEGRADLQLAAVYAAHTHAHHLRYPKGMLLRWFMYLYNLEVCEEDAFLRWREDVTDAYPGKQEALFQVNAWLTWLQQQESEDEDADD